MNGQEARLSLERVKAAVQEKALRPEAGSKQPSARRVLRQVLYDSEDDGRYYSDEEITYRKVRSPTPLTFLVFVFISSQPHLFHSSRLSISSSLLRFSSPCPLLERVWFD